AAAFYQMDDKSLQVVQTYLLSQIQGVVLTNNNAGAVTFSNNVTVDATHKLIAAHLSGQLGPTPTCVTGAASANLTFLTFDANARDICFNVKLVTGPAPTSGQVFHCTFGTSYASPPHVVWSYNSDAAALFGGRVHTTNETASGFDFMSPPSTAMTASTNYEWM